MRKGGKERGEDTGERSGSPAIRFRPSAPTIFLTIFCLFLGEFLRVTTWKNVFDLPYLNSIKNLSYFGLGFVKMHRWVYGVVRDDSAIWECKMIDYHHGSTSGEAGNKAQTSFGTADLI